LPPVLDRRRFLQASSGLLLGLGLAQVSTLDRARAGAVSPSWLELRRALQGTLLLPGDHGFLEAAVPWNHRFAEIWPAGIARCASTDDVRTSLLWAVSYGMPLVARSGGHSYAGYSTTTGLLIDLSAMNQIAYDSGSGLTHVNGGTRNSDVYAALRRQGRAITHGRCGGVGVAGFVLGGGIGFNMRLRGLACDQLVETEMVTASGEVVHCSDTENADLFWACRGGGGGNFGINTDFTFQTFAVDMMTVYSVTWTSNLESLLPAALDLLPGTTERHGTKLSVINDGTGVSLNLLGQLLGTPTELRSIFAPLYQLAAPSRETVKNVPYWEGQDFLEDADDTPDYSHERSRYVYDPMPAGGSRTILDYMRRWPGTSASAIWKIFLTGDAIAAVPSDATAFVHRTPTMISSIELDWSPQDTIGTVQRNETWLAEFHAAMREYTSDEAYQNFMDEAQNDPLHAYYGANLPRLVEVKRRYDPENVFHFPGSVPLTLGI
jgi:FAD binding domain-containing protein/berberine-like enzyme